MYLIDFFFALMRIDVVRCKKTASFLNRTIDGNWAPQEEEEEKQVVAWEAKGNETTDERDRTDDTYCSENSFAAIINALRRRESF